MAALDPLGRVPVSAAAALGRQRQEAIGASAQIQRLVQEWRDERWRLSKLTNVPLPEGELDNAFMCRLAGNAAAHQQAERVRRVERQVRRVQMHSGGEPQQYLTSAVAGGLVRDHGGS